MFVLMLREIMGNNECFVWVNVERNTGILCVKCVLMLREILGSNECFVCVNVERNTEE